MKSGTRVDQSTALAESATGGCSPNCSKPAVSFSVGLSRSVRPGENNRARVSITSVEDTQGLPSCLMLCKQDELRSAQTGAGSLFSGIRQCNARCGKPGEESCSEEEADTSMGSVWSEMLDGSGGKAMMTTEMDATSFIHARHLNLAELLVESHLCGASRQEGSNTTEMLPSIFENGVSCDNNEVTSYASRNRLLHHAPPPGPSRTRRGATPMYATPYRRHNNPTCPEHLARIQRQKRRTPFFVPGVPFVESPDVSTDVDMREWRRKEAARMQRVHAWVQRGLRWQREEWEAQLRAEAHRAFGARWPLPPGGWFAPVPPSPFAPRQWYF
ncbi:hypothetical protein DQ04_17531010 [Trypanosoma grayi]|uniref:hypothetical protein n=1 Tax=Trypanosoma grayi TaxID=71804 RepID=UPI0004F442D6|nr:hypothetical protein DQ04_17531010 [Trypanosoma grayi]KEG05891.1 hypothetical protein DQ04_17531010 [Trypanosoma grayi]